MQPMPSVAISLTCADSFVSLMFYSHSP
jgi:hypothetical protein